MLLRKLIDEATHALNVTAVGIDLEVLLDEESTAPPEAFVTSEGTRYLNRILQLRPIFTEDGELMAFVLSDRKNEEGHD